MSESKRRRMESEETTLMSCMDDVLEKIFGYIKKPIERNAISAACKRFRELEARTRQHILVYNMYTANPMNMFERFPSVKSITIKGNPRLVDFDILPREWAGHAGPWISAIKAHPQLYRFRIKRMMITDRQIEELCSSCGLNLKIMQFDKCSGFSSAGLLALSKYCKNLTHLGLAQSTIEDSGDTTWVNNLVECCTSLEVLDLSFIDMGDVEDPVLVELAGRCKVLKLWESQNPEKFQPVLQRCSTNLTDLGIERISSSTSEAPLLAKCPNLQGLSGIFDLVEDGMHAFLSVSARLTRLDLSYSILRDAEIAEVLNSCPNLQYLRVLDYAGDRGLEALGDSCKDLHRLVVESPSNDGGVVTHAGLMAVAQGCRNLQKLIFYPSFITNEAFEALAYNCPNLMDVRICLIQSNSSTDQLPWHCLDRGVTALVQHCKLLYRLTLCFDVKSGVEFLTDAGLASIGEYGKKIRVLTLVHCGSTDGGLIPVLRGCTKLQRLEIRKSPFGDESMREVAQSKTLHLKYLHVQGCEVTSEGLNSLASRGRVTNSNFYVEVIGCREPACLEEHRTEDGCIEQHRCILNCSHWQVLAYHSLTEPRDDAPWFIHLWGGPQTLPWNCRTDAGYSDSPLQEGVGVGEEEEEEEIEAEAEEEEERDVMDDDSDDNEEKPLQLMPAEAGSSMDMNSEASVIDLNQPPDREEESYVGQQQQQQTFSGFRMFNDILERGSRVAAEPTLHLGTQPLVLQALL